MSQGVDIVVTSGATGRPELVVEVEAAKKFLEAATEHLKGYMARAGVPLGLVVAGDRLRLLQDTYRAQGAQSIAILVDFETGSIEALRPPLERGMDAALEFEARVQSWLESLPEGSGLRGVPEPLQSLLQDYLVPLVETGAVSAAGPRGSRRRAS